MYEKKYYGNYKCLVFVMHVIGKILVNKNLNIKFKYNMTDFAILKFGWVLQTYKQSFLRCCHNKKRGMYA